MGKEESLLSPLFAFNLGLEAGQLLIVVVFLIFSLLPLKILKVNQKQWTRVVSAIILGMAVMMIIEKIFWQVLFFEY